MPVLRGRPPDKKPPDPCSADEQKERLAAPLREVYDEIRRQAVANQQTTQPIQDRHYLPDAVMRRRQEMLEQAEFNGRFQT